MFVKFHPPAEILRSLWRRCRLVYCPVDIYGSSAEIDADGDALRCFDRILVHCERLRRYFTTYASVDYLDHHLKFLAEPPITQKSEGPLLWIGNRSNLPPVVEWLNGQRLPGELWVLTDFPTEEIASPQSLGFRSHQAIRVGRWTPERHREWTELARAAFDIKGDEFRARHKPPTKALDFLASGLPLAMNSDSSSTEHLRMMYDFSLARLDDWDRWLSDEYWQRVQQLVPRLREELSLDAVATRFLSIVA